MSFWLGVMRESGITRKEVFSLGQRNEGLGNPALRALHWIESAFALHAIAASDCEFDLRCAGR